MLKKQLNIVKGKEETSMKIKPGEEISAASLQNPADQEASFKRKENEEYQG